MASVEQVAYLMIIAHAIDKSRKQACLFQKNATKCQQKRRVGNRKLFRAAFEFEPRNASAHGSFSRKIEGVAHLLDGEQSILVTPTNSLTTRFRDIFSDFVVAHKQSTEAETWLAKPSM